MRFAEWIKSQHPEFLEMTGMASIGGGATTTADISRFPMRLGGMIRRGKKHKKRKHKH